MRRSVGSVGLLLLAAPFATTTCASSDAIVVVKVDADSDVGDVFQLRASISNAGDGTIRFFPTAAASRPITFETSFSLGLPRDRSGALDIALDGIGAASAPVANGAGTVDLRGADSTTVTITLHTGASSCGNGVVDSGEACDDGDRLSTGACDYVCQPRTAGPGTGGGGGGGNGGNGGGGRGGAGGTGGTGPAGTGGGAGTGGTGAAGTGGAGTAGTGGAGTGGTGGTGGAPCVVELLTSGNFEGNNPAWTQVTDARPRALIYDQAFAPGFVPTAQSPTHLAWLGYDVVSMSAALRQQVQVPTDAMQLSISGYYQIQTDESGCQCDFGYVELERPTTGGGTTTTQLEKWSNQDSNTDWAPFSTVLNASTLAGQTLTLQLRAEMDDGVNTSFFFDSISVTANRCP